MVQTTLYGEIWGWLYRGRPDYLPNHGRDLGSGPPMAKGRNRGDGEERESGSQLIASINVSILLSLIALVGMVSNNRAVVGTRIKRGPRRPRHERMSSSVFS